MTKEELVGHIAKRTGIERALVATTLESFMETVKSSLSTGEDVHMRGFGSFVVKHRAQKVGRLLSKGTSVVIPAHNAPVFKASEVFIDQVKKGAQP